MAIKLRWLGHGCWWIEAQGHSILLDPFLDDSPSAPEKSESLSPQTILVSHGHFDHIQDAVKIATRCGATIVSNYEICEWCRKQGVEKLEPMNHGGQIDMPFGKVKYTPAVHGSGLPDGAYGGQAGGFLLTMDRKRIYFACDTALFLDMKLIGAGGLDLAVLPIGDRFTMGPDDAIEAVKLLSPKRVAPAHFNTWPSIAQDASSWANRVRLHTAADPITLSPGESFEL